MSREDRQWTPPRSVTCPTCRYLTKVKVASLHKFKVSEFQDKVKDYLTTKGPLIDKPCVYCLKAPVKRSCFDCRISFCVKCEVKHQKAEEVYDHIVSPISAHQFCGRHPAMFIQWLCMDCKVGVCPLCVTEHKDHDDKHIVEVAKQSRKHLSRHVLDKANLHSDLQVAEGLRLH